MEIQKNIFRAPKRPWKYIKMCWHENIQNNPVGLGERPSISIWRMCGALDIPRSVEPTIKKKYIRTELKIDKRSQLEQVGGHQYPPGSIPNILENVECQYVYPIEYLHVFTTV